MKSYFSAYIIFISHFVFPAVSPSSLSRVCTQCAARILLRIIENAAPNVVAIWVTMPGPSRVDVLVIAGGGDFE